MDKDNRIPIVVGVTGHCAIRPQDIAALCSTVKMGLKKLLAAYPHSPIVMISSLAEGADLLCADVAETLSIPLIAVLPREQSDYELDFSKAARERFLHHCSRAKRVFVAPNTEQIPETGVDRNFQFRQAGIYVATHCNILLALWDGGPGTAAACGTAEAVDFALLGNFVPANGNMTKKEGTIVVHIFTPRGDRAEKDVGTVAVLGDYDSLVNELRKIDRANR